MANYIVDDKELVDSYFKGNEKALATLLARHKSRVFSYIIVTVKDRALAEDFFQDTFMKVIQTIKSGKYNEEGKFLPWVMRIAHNLMIDHFRKQKKMQFVDNPSNDDDFDIFDTISGNDLNGEEILEQNQRKKDLRLYIDKLPDEQKEVIKLRLNYDMSFKEIGEYTNVSINTALGRMRYALINLRKMMEEKEVVGSL